MKPADRNEASAVAVRNSAAQMLIAVALCSAMIALDAYLGQRILGQLAFLVILCLGGLRIWRSRNKRLTDWRYRLALLLLIVGFGVIVVMNLVELMDSASTLVTGRR